MGLFALPHPPFSLSCWCCCFAGYTNTRKRRWVQHPTDPSQNMLTAIRIDKGGAGDAPMKPKVKRGPRNAAAATKKGAAESDEEPKEESSASDPEVEM